MSNIMDSNSLRLLFQMIEEDSHDRKLERLLSDTVKRITNHYDACHIHFKNDIQISIFFCNLEGYSIVISDPLFYKNEDTHLSKVSKDRVCFYLKQIAEYRYA